MALSRSELITLAKTVANANPSSQVAYSFGEEKFSYKDLSDTLRNELYEIAGTPALYRENKNTIFALLEETIDDVLPKEIEDDFYDVITDDWGTSETVTRSCCPICLMKHITDYDLLDYTIAISGKSQTELVNEIRQKFANYSELRQYNRENMRK